jgi:hypothetical protein
MEASFEIRTDRFKGLAPRSGVNDLIGGDELAVWLSGALNEEGFSAVDPWPEDHGWDFAVRHNDDVYLIVCSCDFEDFVTPATEFIVQVGKQRSLMDRLLGRRKLAPSADPVVGAVRSALSSQADMSLLEQGKQLAS